MEKTNPLTNILLLLFLPTRFVRRAVEHDVQLECKSNQQLREAFIENVLPAAHLKKFEDRAWARIRAIRIAFFSALGLTLVALAMGLLTGYCLRFKFGAPSGYVTTSFQIGGAAIILVATLAKVGWRIQSWDGETLPEKIDR